MKFKVDKDVCIGCGACASICDEVFEIKDDGYAEAIDKEITDDEVKENAISAMEGCPTGAIREVKDEDKVKDKKEDKVKDKKEDKVKDKKEEKIKDKNEEK